MTTTTNPTIAVVSGAGSGIGRTVAQELSRTCSHVVVTDVNHQSAADTVRDIADSGGVATAIAADITSIGDVHRLHEEILSAIGVPTLLVNCAGWDRTEPFLQTTPDFWRQVVDINYLGTVSMCHAFVKTMVDSKIPGRIVNIASDAGRVGSSGETVYAGAKGGVIAFTKSLAREVARYRITVNCVSPGPTDTPLFYQNDPKMQAALIRAIPLRRLADPREIASAVEYFAYEGAGFVTGQVLSVSGGLTMVD